MKSVHHVPAQVFTMSPVCTLRQRKVPKRKATPLPVSPSPGGEGAACDARSWGAPRNSLRSSNSAQTSAASQMTKRVCPAAHTPPQLLRFSARSEGGGYRHGPLLRSARSASLRLAWAGRSRPSRRQRAARTDTRRSCVAAAVLVPASHPFWLRREAQELGWVHVPKDTCTSSSGSSMLSEQSSPAGGTQRVHRRPPQIRASQVAPVRPTGRTGDADWGSPSLW
jgi:hypothetical protein